MEDLSCGYDAPPVTISSLRCVSIEQELCLSKGCVLDLFAQRKQNQKKKKETTKQQHH